MKNPQHCFLYRVFPRTVSKLFKTSCGRQHKSRPLAGLIFALHGPVFTHKLPPKSHSMQLRRCLEVTPPYRYYQFGINGIINSAINGITIPLFINSSLHLCETLEIPSTRRAFRVEQRFVSSRIRRFRWQHKNFFILFCQLRCQRILPRTSPSESSRIHHKIYLSNVGNSVFTSLHARSQKWRTSPLLAVCTLSQKTTAYHSRCLGEMLQG